MHMVGLLIALGYYGDVLRWHNDERLRWHNGERLLLGKDEGLRIVEVCTVGGDCLVRHC